MKRKAEMENKAVIEDVVDVKQSIHDHTITIEWLLDSLRENDEEFRKLHGNRPVKNVSFTALKAVFPTAPAPGRTSRCPVLNNLKSGARCGARCYRSRKLKQCLKGPIFVSRDDPNFLARNGLGCPGIITSRVHRGKFPDFAFQFPEISR